MGTQSIPAAEKSSLKEAVSYASGSIVSKIIMKGNAGNVTLFSFDKDQYLSEHTAPFDALVQSVEGKIRITIEGNIHELSEGEIIIMPANKPHALYAVGPCKMLLTMLKG